MSHRLKTRLLSTAIAALLCVPVFSGALAGCKDKGKSDSGDLGYYSLGDVVLNDSYAVNGLDKEIDYLLKLDADKLLYWFYVNAELTPKASGGYDGGWESALIGGHTIGHYLTALAQAYANAGTSEEDKAALLSKIEYIADGFEECQNNAAAAGAEDGFLWGARWQKGMGEHEFQFDNVEYGRTDINSQAWVPWYTMHKILAGLIDVYSLTGNKTSLRVAEQLGDWVCRRTEKWKPSTQKTVLSIEYGGMNDCLYNLYAVTGEEEYAYAAHRFDEEDLFEKILNEGDNYLNNLHANTTIPKIIGALQGYIRLRDKNLDIDVSDYLEVAEKFWTRVVDRHTYVTGGNSEWEHFGADGVLDRERTNANCETCNTYNMLKLSRMLFTLTGNVKYLDFYENTYYNAIWSSQNPETGMTTYFQPMATGYFKVYSTEEHNFWCCTGSGMESFTKLNDSIYYSAGDTVYVSLYLSSELKTKKLDLVQTADLEHSDSVEFELKNGSADLMLRVPEWSDRFEVQINGKAQETAEENGFVKVSLKKGEKLHLELEKRVTAHNLPDGETVYAFKYGPFVLSAQLGTADMRTSTTGVNVTVPAQRDYGSVGSETLNVKSGTLSKFISEIGAHMTKNEDGTFTLSGLDREVTYSYHFRQYTQRYGIYFRFVGSDVDVEEESAYTIEKIDTVQPGYGQYENDEWHQLSGGDETVGSTSDPVAGTSRYAPADTSFTYHMAVKKGQTNYLVLYFCKEDNGKTIRILANETEIYNKTLRYNGPDALYEVLVELPKSVVEAAVSKTSGGETRELITVTFSGSDGQESARIGSYVYTALVTFNHGEFAGVRDESLAYFVDCGDLDPETISSGDKYGKYNSVTEQLYGIDYATGKYWGLVDGSDPALGTAGSASSAGGISSANTWANEQVGADGLASKVTNRYTKNQYENNKDRYLCYQFELDDGEYEIEVYFADPWGCSKNVNVKANGESVVTNAGIGTPVKARVTVTGGFLTLEFETSDKCINLCYIKIYV